MKKGQNYYKRMAVEGIINNHMDTANMVELYNQMAKQNNTPIHIWRNTRINLAEEIFLAVDPYHVLMAAMNGGWCDCDEWCYTTETQRGTELHSFDYMTDRDCPIYVSEILDWLEGEDWMPLENIFTRDDWAEETEDAFRKFAEEDEGFSLVGIGIFIGKNAGIDLLANWDNYIIDMYSE